MSLLVVFFTLSIPVSAVALLHARQEYRLKGRLSVFGITLLCLMFLMPNLVLEYATNYRWPETGLQYFGWALCAAGLFICCYAIVSFNSLSKVFCTDPGELTLTGLYRFSRNPQYVGWLLFVLGFALTDWSWWCFGAVAVIGISIHLLVIIEEEHLHRVFGDRYDAFWRRVPRYVGWPR